MKFVLSWVLSAASLALTAALLGEHMTIGKPDQTLQEKILPIAVVGLVFCIVNTFVAPVVKILSLPFIVLSLGCSCSSSTRCCCCSPSGRRAAADEHRPVPH